MFDTVDVIVVGAGPGGSSTAYYLAKRGLNVLLIDRNHFPREKVCGDGLTPKAIDELDKMQLLDDVQKQANRIEKIAVYNHKGDVIRANIPSENGFRPYLLVVKRIVLDDLLRQHAVEAGARFFGGLKVVNIERENGLIHVLAKGKQTIENFACRVLVLAVGANSRLLMKMGLYQQTAPMIIAARAYYSEIRNLPQVIEARMENVQMPGYGWVFPTGESTANIGVGYWKPRRFHGEGHRSIRSAFNWFVNGSSMKTLLKGARQIGAVKSFPLRVDFTRSKTYRKQILLVGEAAGLVNPLTGEGVDLALESGRIAAQSIVRMFVEGDFSESRFQYYDVMLRKHFQRPFVTLNILRRLYINSLVAGRTIRVASKDEALSRLFVKIFLGYKNAEAAVTPKVLWRILRG